VPCDWGRATAALLTLHKTVDVRFQGFPLTEHEIGEDQVRKGGGTRRRRMMMYFLDIVVVVTLIVSDHHCCIFHCCYACFISTITMSVI
jgi:hypothetical protein